MQPTAADIAKILNARKCGGSWMALCPAHKEKTPSLAIRESKDGKPLVHCFGGCPQDYVIDALRKRGAWHDGPTAVTSQVLRNLAQKAKPMTAELTDDEKENQAACQRAWDAAVPAENTPAQLYLQCRGIVSAETPLPPSLRYLEAKNALVAAVTRPDSEELVGLHVIFLEEDGAGVWKKAKLSYGPVRLGHVKLSAPDTKMQVAESIEDGLALMQMNGRATLAVPGTSFLGGHVIPPKTCQTILLAPDNDTAGRAAIEKATPRLQNLSFTVRVLLPPPEYDWCDVLPEFEERRAIVEEEYIG
jgi:hypothetical protein